jgi:TRAP-type C4-dicarboxylate transport system permease small subunit
MPGFCTRPADYKPAPRERHATIRTASADCEDSMLHRFDRTLLALNRGLIIAILVAMATIVFVNVVLRFTTDRSLLFVEEAARYLMIWLTFLGAGPVLRYGGHLGIDTLQERLPRQAATIRGAIFAILLGFFAFMVWVGVRYALFAWGQTTPVLGIPIGAVYLAMPIGFALAILHLLVMAGPYIRRRALLADGEFDADAANL